MGSGNSNEADSNLNSSSEGQCSTTIKATEFRFTWIIKNYMYCQKAVGQFLQSGTFQTADNGNSKWCLKLYPRGNELRNANYVSLRLNLISSKESEVTTKFSFSLLDIKGEETNVDTFEHVFKEGEHYGTNRYLRRTEAPGEVEAFDDKDQLEIVCNLTIFNTEISIERSNSPALEIPPSTLSEDMASLFESKELSDFTISCTGRDLHCHKAIIAARSPVIRSMFKHSTREYEQNRVIIRDIEVNAVESLLRFMYTGKAPPKEKLTKELLIAADKYDVQRLKLMCEEALSSGLTEGSALETLKFADKYNAENLKRHTIQFIGNNAKQLTSTEEWKRLIYEHPDLIVGISLSLHSSKS